MIRSFGLAAMILISASSVSANENSVLDIQNKPAEMAIETVIPNIKKGHIAVSGTFGIGYSVYTIGSSTYTSSQIYASPAAEYFVIDQLSIGGSITASFEMNYTYLAVGPSATYHFRSGDRWTIPVGAAFGYSSTKDSRSSEVERIGEWNAHFSVGTNYFLTPSVAFGPQFSFSYSGGKFENYSNSGLRFQFAIFL